MLQSRLQVTKPTCRNEYTSNKLSIFKKQNNTICNYIIVKYLRINLRKIESAVHGKLQNTERVIKQNLNK